MNIFKDVLTLINTEEGQKALPILANALTGIAGNPTAINATAQGASALSQLINAEISIGQDALKAIASDVSAIAAHAASTAAPAVPTPAAPAAA